LDVRREWLAQVIALDTSALIAIAHREERSRVYRAILQSSTCIVGATTLVETHMVLGGRKAVDPIAFIAALHTELRFQVIPFDLTHFHTARDAFDLYGKGRGHPAQLNFGDCLSYAVAKVAGVPLLYAGADFALTDIASALRV
jgi:ribonuclease VapC